jgi:hypothetical protein
MANKSLQGSRVKTPILTESLRVLDANVDENISVIIGK